MPDPQHFYRTPLTDSPGYPTPPDDNQLILAQLDLIRGELELLRAELQPLIKMTTSWLRRNPGNQSSQDQD